MAIDPRFRQLLQPISEATKHAFVETVGAVPSAVAGQSDTVDVIVTADGDVTGANLISLLEQAGMKVHSLIEGPTHVVTGEAPTDRLQSIDAVTGVERVHAARDLFGELDTSGPIVNLNAAHGSVPPQRGGGVLIGIIDTGIDWRHPDFIQNNASRILRIWDQTAASIAGQAVPHGREFSQQEIDQALASGVNIPHGDAIGHGTHVTSIAAGGDGRFTGVAPDADLVVVALGHGAALPGAANVDTLGRSSRAIEAINYIQRIATELDRPVAINVSQGTNGGAHSGESPLELALDSTGRRQGMVAVKSAGNEQQWRIHASGRVEAQPGQVLVREIEAGLGIIQQGILEVWYDGADELEVAIEPPGGPVSAFCTSATAPTVEHVAHVNRVTIEHDANVDQIGDNVFTLFFTPGAGALLPGVWKLHVRGGAMVHDGRFDAWFERARRHPTSQQLRFVPGSEDPTGTLSVPGTARRAVVVASTVSHPRPAGSALVGAVSDFSSRGPTRYGLAKPDLAAPGEWITAAGANQAPGTPPHVSNRGTSMAAPHVTGAAALVLSQRPALTGEQVRQILSKTARPLGTSPDEASGAGALDIEAALREVGGATFPSIENVTVNGAELQFDTDIPTTATLEYGRHRRRLVLGRKEGSLSRMAPATHHSFDLQQLAPGTYHCIPLAFSQDGWETREDNGGRCWSVDVT